MTVSEVLTFARNGEFRGISQSKYNDATLISYINMAMIEIYKRFVLKTSETIIDLNDDDTIYSLPDDCMTILAIYDEDGAIYKLNDEDDKLSILTVSWNQIQVPNPATGASISIIYNSNPSVVSSGTDVVQIPPILLEALLNYMAYKAYQQPEGEVNGKSDSYFLKFESSCTRVRDLGLVTQDDVAFKRTVQENGFP
jgi:hypothetical protein